MKMKGNQQNDAQRENFNQEIEYIYIYICKNQTENSYVFVIKFIGSF